MWLVGLCAFIICLGLFFAKEDWQPIGSNAYVHGFIAVKNTIETARSSSNINPLENAAIQHKIIEQNKLLARTKYYRKYFSLWISPKIDELKPIK